jgi:hypothetical protein
MPIPVSPSDFRFETDEQSVTYLWQVVEAMMKSFGVAREEAIGRINQEWSPVRRVVGEFDEIYRETPAYWANHFMFGKSQFWWIEGAKRAQLKLPPLVKLPYPRNAEGA